MLDAPRAAGPYRTPASVPPCLGCPPLEAAALAAYLKATHAQRAAANEIVVCDVCGRTCGVRVWVGARARRLAADIDRVDAATTLETELRGVWTVFTAPSIAPTGRAASDEPKLSTWDRLLGWLRAIR